MSNLANSGKNPWQGKKEKNSLIFEQPLATQWGTTWYKCFPNTSLQSLNSYLNKISAHSPISIPEIARTLFNKNFIVAAYH